MSVHFIKGLNVGQDLASPTATLKVGSFLMKKSFEVEQRAGDKNING